MPPGGRLAQTCEDDAAACASPSRRVELDQDDLGRTLVTRAIKGGQTLVTTWTYGVDGQPTGVASVSWTVEG